MWIDDVTLDIVGETAGGSQQVANPSFEEGEEGWQPDDWEMLGATEAAGYALTRSAEQPYSGHWSGLLASADPKTLVPDPGEPFVADLGGGVSALIPLALWADASGTLPHPDPGTAPPQPDKPAGFTISGDDRASRLAIAALAWRSSRSTDRRGVGTGGQGDEELLGVERTIGQVLQDEVANRRMLSQVEDHAPGGGEAVEGALELVVRHPREVDIEDAGAELGDLVRQRLFAQRGRAAFSEVTELPPTTSSPFRSPRACLRR